MSASLSIFQRIIKSNFYNVLIELYTFASISGPPESMREHVVAASKAMKKGDWKQFKNYILAVKVILN